MRRSSLGVWFAITVSVLAQPASGQESDANAVAALEAAAGLYASFETLCADFHQLLEVTLLNREREGTGELCQRAPNLFSMRFSEPAGDAIVADGEFLWLFTPSNDPSQVLRIKAEEADGGFNFHRTFLTDPASKFVVADEGTEDVEGHTARRVRVEPRKAAGFVSARVWIDIETKLLVRISIEDLNESIRTVTLTNQRIDPQLATEVFHFDPPPGTRVVQR